MALRMEGQNTALMNKFLFNLIIKLLIIYHDVDVKGFWR